MKTRLQQWLVSLGILSLFGVAVCLPGTALAATRTPQVKAIPQVNVCTAEYGFKILSHNNYLNHTQPTQVLDNDTTSSKNFLFSVTVNKTVNWTFSASFSFEEGVIFTEAKETYGLSYSTSVSTSLTNTASGSVPAGHEVVGNYGIFESDIVGDYIYTFSNCTTKNYGQMEVWLPYQQGWEITQNSN